MSNNNLHKSWKEKAQEAFDNMHNEGYTWDDIQSKINEAIEAINRKSPIKLKINSKTYYKGWQNIITDSGGSRMNPEKWQDLFKVWEYLTNNSTGSSNSPIRTTEAISNQPFTYCTPKFQDTILPYLYKHFYKDFKNIKFDINRDWNEILEAFELEDIQVAVNNFSTALAITRSGKESPEMFFFPFFLFKGYVIIIKKGAIEAFCTKHNIRNNGFNKLSTDYKKIFLENSTVTLEPQTDVEWVYKKYCAKYDADWNVVNKKILPLDVNEGKKKFILKNGTDVYCTNSIHLADLGKQTDKYEVIKNDEVTKHKNVNGLLCTMDFFNQNSATVRKLITIWFHHIEEFIKEKEEIQHNSDVAPFTSDLLKGFNHSLNIYTYSNISLHELMNSYKTNNEFFTDALKAFHEFFTADFVEQHITNKSFWEIANIQLGQEDEDSMQEIISKIHSNMKKAFTKLNIG